MHRTTNNMENFYTFCYASLTLLTLFFLFRRLRKSKLPPGPPSLPLIGNLLQLGKDTHLIYESLAQKYGPIVFLQLGSFPCIVVSDVRIAEEVLIKKGIKFADRTPLQASYLFTPKMRDIAFGRYDDTLKFHRKIARNALMMFGEGMYKLEGLIQNEIDILTRSFKMLTSTPFYVGDVIDEAVLNFICRVVFGRTYKKNDPEFLKLQQVVRLLVQPNASFDIMEVLPFLHFTSWFYKSESRRVVEKAVQVRNKIFYEKFKAAKATFNGGIVRNYMEALLQAAADARYEDSDLRTNVYDDYFVLSMFDIFLAGSESSAASIKWAILYLIVWPEIQEKVFRELHQVVGKASEECYVTLKDRKSLPYTEVVLLEVLRLSSVAYLGVWHQTTSDISLFSYQIPKGFSVIINYWKLNHDPNLWDDPFGFHPERFLDNEGKPAKNMYPGFLPFSAGHRQCIGEPLANLQLFLFVANLVHRFKFSSPPSVHHPSLKGKAGVILDPEPYEVVIEKRF